MALAQALYQKGFITYIRTASNTISSEFISNRQNNFFLDKYGQKYFHLPKQAKKSQNNQEAHFVTFILALILLLKCWRKKKKII